MRPVSTMKEETQRKICVALMDLWCYLVCIRDALWHRVAFGDQNVSEDKLFDLAGINFLGAVGYRFKGSPDFPEISVKITEDLIEVANREKTEARMVYAVCSKAIERFDEIHRAMEQQVDVRLKEYELVSDASTKKNSDCKVHQGKIIPLQLGYYLYRMGQVGELLEADDAQHFSALHLEQVRYFGFGEEYTLLIRSELLEDQELLLFLLSLLPRELVNIVASYDVAREKSVIKRLFTRPEFNIS